MTPLFRKLNLKDHGKVHVLDAPPSFEPELEALEGVAIARKLGRADRTTFALAFVITQKQLDTASAALARAAEGDAILWFAYPKGSSKRYRCEFNRDSGWKAMGDAGFEPVRMVAIDEDWSAVRFRRAEHIKTLTRGAQHAISAQGRRRAGKERA